MKEEDTGEGAIEEKNEIKSGEFNYVNFFEP